MADLQALLARVCDLEKAATSIGDAWPFLFISQGTTPYWVNFIRGPQVDDDSEGYDVYTYDVLMRLIIGHVTEGADGEPEGDLYTYIPQVIEYFRARPLLIDDTYTTELDALEEARVVEGTGFAVFSQTGVRTAQIGCQFTLRCRFEEEISYASFN